jgi:nucleoside-diphosphate-sugar epimerase
MAQHFLITGATGFIGGHVAEACAARGWSVSALARASSDTTALKRLGATIHTGDVTDATFVRQSTEDVDGVIHCAAKVGDWGPVEEYRKINVEGLRALLEACKGRALARFVHLSSLGVYPARHHYGTDETEPLPARHADGYTQSKVEAEQLALRYQREAGVPVVVLRPGFVYGPGDRTVMPRLIENLRKETVRYPGARGQRALNTVYVKNLVEAIFLAIENPRAVGQVYNLTDGEFVSKRGFIEAVADAMALPRPWRCPPLWAARILTWGSETWAHLRGATEAPLFTRARLKFLGLNLDFSIDKAKRELGYRPRYSFDQAIAETMAYYKGSGVRDQGSEVVKNETA